MQIREYGLVWASNEERIYYVVHNPNVLYLTLGRYLRFAATESDQLMRNSRLRAFCDSPFLRSRCYDPKQLGKLCSLYPLQVMKTVRIGLRGIRRLMIKAERCNKV